MGHFVRNSLAALLPAFIPALLFSQQVTLTPYVSGLSSPIAIRHCGDGRLFIAQRTGQVRIVNADGTLRPVPFLDIADSISSNNSEEGFLSFCFSPDYKSSGKWYVSYTDSINGQLYGVVMQYLVNPADSNLADLNSGLRILQVRQPYQNHNGGDLHFGPDGYLYLGLGDGGSGGDPQNRAQNTDSLLGKILRIDVQNATVANPYAIPPGNPLAGAGGSTRPEIWAYGVRNPWRTSFDRLTGDFWIADVGQNNREEIDFQSASVDTLRNYGWRRMEGTACYNPSGGCELPGMIAPIYDYDHSTGHSVTGGYVYRGVQSRALWGMYLFSDYTGGWIDGLREANNALDGSVTRLMTSSGGQPIAFGEDQYGELYACLYNNGTVYRVDDTNPDKSPKAYFTATDMGASGTRLQAYEGAGLSYLWLKDQAPIAGASSPQYMATENGTYNLVVTNGAGNDDTSASFVLAAVPVTLSQFNAARTGDREITLTWTTESEQHNQGFFVQRRAGNDPAFSDLAFVPSKAPDGNYTGTLHYQYLDTMKNIDVVLYRLRQTDRDGREHFSQVIAVHAFSQAPEIEVVPNPARDRIRILFHSQTRMSFSVQLTDGNGTRLREKVCSGNECSISTSDLQRGVYYVRIMNQANKISEVRRVLVE